MSSALAWITRRLAEQELARAWPLARICGQGERLEDWLAYWRVWLASGRRHAMVLTAVGGHADLAAWTAEICSGPHQRQTYLVARLWLVEPGLPGRVLGAWFACVRDLARRNGCTDLEVPLSAVPAAFRGEVTARLASAAGYQLTGAGWQSDIRAPSDGQD